jgi:hypothetical protein
LPIAFSAEGWMSFPEITKWANTRDHVLLIDLLIDDFEVLYDREGKKLKLEDGVLAVSHYLNTGIGYIRLSSGYREMNWPKSSPVLENTRERLGGSTLKVAVIEAVAKAWSSYLQDILQASDFPDDGKGLKYVGMRDKKRVQKAATITIKKPKSLEIWHNNYVQEDLH